MELSHIYQDVGVSGTDSRRGWHSLDARLAQGDTLVIDGCHYVLFSACCRSVGGPGLLDGFAVRLAYWVLGTHPSFLSNGFSTLTSVGMKSRTLRVTTVKSWFSAVAAICRSELV